jgi:hypothetical protein
MWFSSPIFLAGRRQVRMSSSSGANLEIVLPLPFLWDLSRSSQVFPLLSAVESLVKLLQS